MFNNIWNAKSNEILLTWSSWPPDRNAMRGDLDFFVSMDQNKFLELGSIYNVYNVPSELEQTSEARKAVVANSFKYTVAS